MITPKFDPRDAGFHIQSRDGKDWEFIIENESLKLLKSSGFELHVCGMGDHKVAIKLVEKRGVIVASSLPKLNGRSKA